MLTGGDHTNSQSEYPVWRSHLPPEVEPKESRENDRVYRISEFQSCRTSWAGRRTSLFERMEDVVSRTSLPIPISNSTYSLVGIGGYRSLE